jgi:hypothetical protein
MKNKFFFIIVTVILGIILSYLYGQLVVSYPQEKFKEFRKTVYLEQRRTGIDFDLPKDAYLLKLKHIIQEDQPKEIFVNGFQVTSDVYHYIRRRGIIETDYIHLPKETTKEGRNKIEINFLKNKPPDLDIILSNYRKKIGNDIYILFSDSANLPSGKISFKTTTSIVIIVFLFFSGMIYLLSRFLSLNINKLLLYQIYSFLPFLIFLSSIWIGSNLSRIYRVVITPSYFWTFGMISFFFTEGSIVLKKLLQGYRLKEEKVKSLKEINIDNITEREELWIINPKVKDFTDKTFSWIKSREFSDKCILLFMALLIMCAFLLILHLEPFAEQLANVAYFALVVGVGIKFVKFVKEERLEKKKDR